MTRSYQKTQLKISPSLDYSPQEYIKDSKPIFFDQATIDSVLELGSVLQKIHNRLLSEGYCIMKDRILNSEGEILYEKSKTY